MNESTRHLMARAYFPAGTVIFRQGDDGDRAYVVESGEIEIARTEGTTRRILGVVKKGGIFGEMALIDNEKRMAEAVALSETTCFVVERDQFGDKFDSADPFIKGMIRIFVRNIRSMADDSR
jgi:CRP/FNR family transcriptional regulator, cyclic AMP receptor protein